MNSSYCYKPYAFFFLIAPIFFLVGCGEKQKTPLAGDRISILESEFLLRQDPDAEFIAIDMSEPDASTEWPQPGHSAHHVLPHPEFDGLNQVVWNESIGAGDSGSRALVSPLIGADGMIFAMNARNIIRAVSADSGDSIWEHEPTATLDHVGGGIAYADDAIYATYPDGTILKLEAKTGKEIWSRHVPYIIRTAPSIADGRLSFVTSNNKSIALDMKTGDIIWTHTALEESLTFVGGASPAATGLVTLVPYSSGELHALHPANGYSLWSDTIVSLKGLDSKSMIGQMTALPVIHKDRVFVISHSDHFIAFDLRTGQRLWEKPLGGRQTPLVTEDFIFLLTNNNDLVCLTRGTGRVIWVHSLPVYEKETERKGRITWTGPVLAGNKLLIAGTSKQAMTLSPQDGQVLETMDLPGAIQLSPIVMNKMAYFMTTSGSVIAVK